MKFNEKLWTFFYRNVTHTVIWLQVPKWIRASLGCSAPQERWCTSRFFILKGINCNCSFALKLFYWWPNWFSFYLMWFFNASFNKISQVNNIISSFYSISYFGELMHDGLHIKSDFWWIFQRIGMVTASVKFLCRFWLLVLLK